MIRIPKVKHQITEFSIRQKKIGIAVNKHLMTIIYSICQTLILIIHVPRLNIDIFGSTMLFTTFGIRITKLSQLESEKNLPIIRLGFNSIPSQ